MSGKVQKGKRPKHCPSPYPTKRAKSKPKSKPAMDLAIQAADPAMPIFQIEYLSDMPSEGDIAMGNLTSEQKELIDKSECIKSPFNPRGVKPGELDQRVRITPYDEWSRMKKYANFVSKWCLIYLGFIVISGLTVAFKSKGKYTPARISCLLEATTPHHKMQISHQT